MSEIKPLSTRFNSFIPIVVTVCLFIGLSRDNQILTSAGILFIMLYGLIWVWWKLSFIGLTSRLEFSEIRAFEGEEVELRIITTNRKYLPVFWLNVVYELPKGLKMKQIDLTISSSSQRGYLRSYWFLNPWQTVLRRFEIECTDRGYYHIGPGYMETGDPFGFFSGRMTLPETFELIIYPKVYPIDEMSFPARQPFGEFRSVGRLFEDPMRTIGIRDWQMGDSQRRIHWKATAKYQTLFSRVYEPAEEEKAMIFLNIATLENFWHGYIPELQEQAIRVASSLAYELSEKRLPVGLIANGRLFRKELAIKLLPGRSPDQLMLILELLAGVTSFATSSIEDLLISETPGIPWGTTLILITAVTHDALLATLLDLTAAGRPIVLISLAKEPPTEYLPQITVYHLPYFDISRDDIIAPVRQS
ncbi:MAG: hypothetical protein ACI9EW_000283 [Cellvibrionaceae bacterium]|jgi:uncharacterized protein (DUF58 family)